MRPSMIPEDAGRFGDLIGLLLMFLEDYNARGPTHWETADCVGELHAELQRLGIDADQAVKESAT